MDKLNLKTQKDFGKVLTKEELKQVFGGFDLSLSLSMSYISEISVIPCGMNKHDYISACAGKSEGQSCSYCILQGTPFEQLVLGTCKKPLGSVVIIQKEMYCDR